MGTGTAAAVRHVVLDRDGVLARETAGQLVVSRADWRWETGARRALRLLGAAGCTVSIATNQSCIARGTASAAAVAELHGWLADEITDLGVAFNGTFVCPHGPDDGCPCRKPAPGLVLEAVRRSGIEARHTVLIGDAATDAAAAAAAGVQAVLVRTGKAGGAAPPPGVPGFDDVADAVAACLDLPAPTIGAGS